MNCEELSRLSAHRIQQCRLLHTRKVFNIDYLTFARRKAFLCAQMFRKFKLYFGTTLRICDNNIGMVWQFAVLCNTVSHYKPHR